MVIDVNKYLYNNPVQSLQNVKISRIRSLDTALANNVVYCLVSISQATSLHKGLMRM